MKFNLLLVIAIFWFIYCLSIISMSSCSLFMKESEDNEWNLYYTNVDDETGEEYDVFHDGPMSITEAKEIIRFVEDSDYRQGISPIALLGASIYLACKETKVRRSQLEIAKTLGTSEVTLRNRAKEIKSLLNSA